MAKKKKCIGLKPFFLNFTSRNKASGPVSLLRIPHVTRKYGPNAFSGLHWSSSQPGRVLPWEGTGCDPETFRAVPGGPDCYPAG